MPSAYEIARILTGKEPVKSGAGYKISCPVEGHEDRHPSAEIGDIKDGGIWCKCYSRCGAKAPWHALKQRGLIEEKYQKKVKWELEECEKKLTETNKYYWIDGKLHSMSKRFDLIAPDGTPVGKKYIRLNAEGRKPGPGFKYILYRLPEVVAGAKDGRVIVDLEGESKADLVASLGLCATSFIGGCKSIGDWLAFEPWKYLEGCDFVALVYDHDQEGYHFACQKAAALHEHKIPCKLVALFNTERPKNNGLDIKEWIKAYGKTADDLKQVIIDAPFFQPTEEQALAAQEGKVLELFPLDAERVLSESFAAEIFLKEYEDQIYYIQETKSWHYFDGQILARDPRANKVHRLAQIVCDRKMPAIIMKERVDPLRARRWIAQLKDKAAIRSVVAIAEWHAELQIDELDADPLVINLQNCTYDFRTASARKPSGKDKITKMAGFAYKPGSRCPRWLEFLKWCFGGDSDLILYNQIWAGYCLLGLTSEQKIRINHGGGGNGKSVDSNTRMRLGGTYASVVPSRAFMKHQHETQMDSLSQLKGLRHAVLSEIARGQTLDDAKIKDVSGGDVLKVRYLFEEPQDMINQCKLEFRTNYKPGASSDDALHRRLQIVPYRSKVTETKQIIRDYELKMIEEEGSGIGEWMLAGAHLYLETGLPEPEQIKIENAKYKQEIDLVSQCCCEWFEPFDGETSQRFLYAFYKKWCHAEGYELVYSPATLAQELERLGYPRVVTDRGQKNIRGLRVRDVIQHKHGNGITEGSTND